LPRSLLQSLKAEGLHFYRRRRKRIAAASLTLVCGRPGEGEHKGISIRLRLSRSSGLCPEGEGPVEVSPYGANRGTAAR
jgi:hypothetical protein